jgi:hypothetical protein
MCEPRLGAAKPALDLIGFLSFAWGRIVLRHARAPTRRERCSVSLAPMTANRGAVMRELYHNGCKRPTRFRLTAALFTDRALDMFRLGWRFLDQERLSLPYFSRRAEAIRSSFGSRHRGGLITEQCCLQELGNLEVANVPLLF